MKILIVDDDRIHLRILESAMSNQGLQIETQDDPEKAWEKLKTDYYDIIFLDWLMPGIDGIELCKRIRTTSHGKKSIVIIVTVRNTDKDIDQILAAGANDYIPKPLDIKNLLVRLRVAKNQSIQLNS